MKKFLTMFIFSILVVSCNEPSISDENMPYDLVGVEFYNEFIPCVGGEDFNQDNVSNMMKGWRSLNVSDDLIGAWGYVPVNNGNRFESGYWELQWASKEEADLAWSEWMSDEEAQTFMSANESVMVCRGEDRVSFDFTFYRDVESFGAFPEDGTFFSEFFPCKFNDEMDSANLMSVITSYNSWLDTLEITGSYSFGIYMDDGSDELADFWWGNFHESEDSAKIGNQNWLDTGGDAKTLLESTVTCDVPDVYNSGTIYDPARPQFAKS